VQHYKREWGPRAQTTRFAATTVDPTPKPQLTERVMLKQRDASPAPPVAAVVTNASTESSSPWVAHQKVQGMIYTVFTHLIYSWVAHQKVQGMIYTVFTHLIYS
jgi:hypothetical protein